MSSVVFRIVPKDVAAEGYDDDGLDLEQPCDLAVLEDAGADGETELARKKFDSGNEASAYLLSLIRREKQGKE